MRGISVDREKKNGITKSFIENIFKYEDGNLLRINGHRKRSNWSRSVNSRGYMHVSINRKTYLVHRLIWILCNGDIPDGLMIDHINRNKLDNRIENLRPVSRRLNSSNHGIKTRSGYPGVWWYDRCKTWLVRIQVNKKTIYLGYYKDLDVAIAIRKNAEVKYKTEAA